MKAGLRIADANLNRCREALRVLEDSFRFGRFGRGGTGDPRLTRRFSLLRHRLDRMAAAAYPRLLRSRDSLRDVARARRGGLYRNCRELIAANFRRAQEALRVLEEYGRLISPRHASGFARLRFDLYDLEKRAMLRRRRGSHSLS